MGLSAIRERMVLCNVNVIPKRLHVHYKVQLHHNLPKIVVYDTKAKCVFQMCRMIYCIFGDVGS